MFKSKAQQAYLFAHHPNIAEEFAENTPKSSYKTLAEYVSKDKNRLKTYTNKHRRKKDER